MFETVDVDVRRVEGDPDVADEVSGEFSDDPLALELSSLAGDPGEGASANIVLKVGNLPLPKLFRDIDSVGRPRDIRVDPCW